MDSDKVTRFEVKLLWTPDINNPALNLFLKNLEEKVILIKQEGHNYSNFSGDEIRALKDLKGRRNIVIKEADKGLAVGVKRIL